MDILIKKKYTLLFFITLILSGSCRESIVNNNSLDKGNYPPIKPKNMVPKSMSTGNDFEELWLSWESGDLDNDSLSYDIYFGESISTLKIVGVAAKENRYKVTNLNPSSLYYWKIVVKDGKDSITSSTLFFVTKRYNNPLLIGNWSGLWHTFWKVTYAFGKTEYSLHAENAVCADDTSICRPRLEEVCTGEWHTKSDTLILIPKTCNVYWYSYTDFGRVIDSTKEYEAEKDSIIYTVNVDKIEFWDDIRTKWYTLCRTK